MSYIKRIGRLVPGPDQRVVLPRHRPLVHQQRRAAGPHPGRQRRQHRSRRRSRGTARSTSRRSLDVLPRPRPSRCLGVPGAQPLPALRLDHVPQRPALHARRVRRQRAQPVHRRARLAPDLRDRPTTPRAASPRVGTPWWWFDLNVERRIGVAGSDLAVHGGGREPLQPEERRHRQPGHRPRPTPTWTPTTDSATLRGNAAYDVTTPSATSATRTPTRRAPAVQPRPLPPAAPRPVRAELPSSNARDSACRLVPAPPATLLRFALLFLFLAAASARGSNSSRPSARTARDGSGFQFLEVRRRPARRRPRRDRRRDGRRRERALLEPGARRPDGGGTQVASRGARPTSPTSRELRRRAHHGRVGAFDRRRQHVQPLDSGDMDGDDGVLRPLRHGPDVPLRRTSPAG